MICLFQSYAPHLRESQHSYEIILKICAFVTCNTLDSSVLNSVGNHANLKFLSFVAHDKLELEMKVCHLSPISGVRFSETSV